ncbi:cyclophilin-like fold protein [Helicobacter turcicus]|uniref:Cyclophilin-like domain-containing protein n=1 Tax=Helicobacter turcicus TaxID=2867412 RepID=A0ABS7JL15_9HELI|nr:cyclophilin-like fold protein [Helicobacter turcicus]MBX7490092.1 hypothetical protein [Helicobacter turcicus]MBX7544951.1 hypothetical protein [Helicobacter turcicus]
MWRFLILFLILLGANAVETQTKIIININDKKYIAQIYNNPSAQLFAKKLPQTLTLKELNGNEKYGTLPYTLPSNSSNPKTINAGDIMLHGEDCLVIFYKSFNTNYSYTKIGHIENLPHLGDGDISVRFERFQPL